MREGGGGGREGVRGVGCVFEKEGRREMGGREGDRS